MKTAFFRLLSATLLSSFFFNFAAAQNSDKPAYLDTNLSPEQRAADLVKRMTLEEKATQLVNQARAVPRLKVPAYDWWSESLHGVAVNGTTEFPEPVGLAATFDTDAIHKMAEVISTEGRIKHVQAVRANGGFSYGTVIRESNAESYQRHVAAVEAVLERHCGLTPALRRVIAKQCLAAIEGGF